jgi:ABC-type antimicrobial peptide transport system permease subunit
MTAEATRILEDVFGRGRVTKVTTFASQVDGSIVPERMMASLASFFGAVGALLASAGIYAVLAMAVARRTREIGLRMALGASRRSIVTTVVVRAMSLAACGIALGIPVTLWSGRFAGAMVEHLTPGGWRPLVVTAVATVIIGTVGAAVPARRATRVDPLTALRAD